MPHIFKSCVRVAFGAICLTTGLITVGKISYTFLHPHVYLYDNKNDHQQYEGNYAELPDLKQVSTMGRNENEDGNIVNWVVLLTFNNGYIEFFQNWFWHFNRLQLQVPVIVIAEDDACFNKLKSLYENTGSVRVERSNRNNTELVADYKSPSFNSIVGGRPIHILKQLKLGDNVIYCDVDSVWLQNPFPYFSGDFDIWAQLDGSRICTGFLAIKTNNRTIDFTSEWVHYLAGQNNKNHDQHGFRVVYEKSDKLKLQLKILDSDLFPAGNMYFNHFDDEKRTKVVVVHNNYIRGYDEKLERFKKFHLWKIPTNQMWNAYLKIRHSQCHAISKMWYICNYDATKIIYFRCNNQFATHNQQIREPNTRDVQTWTQNTSFS